MTLFASRDSISGVVTVHVTYGPVSITVDEAEGHMLQFWHELGQLVAAEDNEKRARAGYERARELMRQRGEAICTWDGLLPENQDFWVAAFTE
ncbi:MAG TPA: hypothetical protein VGG75_14295 [Trebonia sp.]|jgi:hypothetical protein